MNKLHYLTLGAAGLILASCSQEPVNAPLVAGDGEGNVHVTLRIPANLTSRAVTEFGTAKVANNLNFAIYDGKTLDLIAYEENSTTFTEEGDYLTTTVNLNLAAGKTYQVAFFAQSEESEEAGVYNFDPANNVITVNYANMTSEGNLDDDYDCFFKLQPIDLSQGQTSFSALLTRPVAQINWGTSDLNDPAVNYEGAYGENGKYIQTYLTVNAYNTFDILTGEVSGQEEYTFTVPFTAPCAEEVPVMFPYNGDIYAYVAMNYILAPADAALLDVALKIDNGANLGVNDMETSISVSQVPVQANYQTNIYGNLLSTDVEVEVTKNPMYETPSNDFPIGSVQPSQDENDNWLIMSQANLNWLAEKVNGGDNMAGQTFVLKNDITLIQDFSIIGLGQETPFQGTFDGEGHTLYNVSISRPSGNYLSNTAMFGYTSGNAEIKNLTLENVTVTGYGTNVGALIGTAQNFTTVSGITLQGKVQIDNPSLGNVGGLIGLLGEGLVSDITIDVDGDSYVNGLNNVGGVIGLCYNFTKTIENITSNINVTAKTSNVGGIMGVAPVLNQWNDKITNITNCVCTAQEVTLTDATDANAYTIGGIAGTWSPGNNAEINLIFTDCSFDGELVSDNADLEGFDLQDNNKILGVAPNITSTEAKVTINGDDSLTDYHVWGTLEEALNGTTEPDPAD